MSIEAMKQALEAMEKHGTFYLRHEHAYKKAITALRQAIAEAEKQEPVANMLGNMFEACGIGIGFGDAKLESSNVTHIYSTGVPMAKPDAVQYDKDGNEMAHWRFNQTPLKQEPVAWIVDGEIKVRLDMAGKLYYSETNVYGKDVVNKAIEQEPVGWLDSEGRFSYFKHLDSDEPLYTAPLKKEWVGLDPETMRNTTLDFNHGALWAERYLKEKNT